MRGIKISSHKEKTRFEKTGSMPLPGNVTLYTSQHIGAPSEVIVKKGDEVARGELVARAVGHCSCNLHSPVSGKVTDVSAVDRPGGTVCSAVMIKSSGDQGIQRMEPLKEITPETVRERVRQAGIVGLGGAGFPAHVKLDPPKKIHTAILNGCECEPFLTADERIMIEESEKVVEGLLLIRDAVGAEKAVIGIEDDKPEAISAIRASANIREGVEVVSLPKIYPQGYEKMLITAVTGNEVPSGGLPHDVGVSVHNAGTCLAVFEAVMEGKPLIERVITVSGPQIFEGCNIKVSLGTAISEVLSYCHFKKSGKYNIVMGGPMMGFSLDNLEAGLLKTTSGILVLEAEYLREYPCIRCGKCIDKCPMRLLPQELNKFYSGGSFEKMNDTGLLDCMECGCCTYVCPSRIPLTQNFKAAKRKR